MRKGQLWHLSAYEQLTRIHPLSTVSTASCPQDSTVELEDSTHTAEGRNLETNVDQFVEVCSAGDTLPILALIPATTYRLTLELPHSARDYLLQSARYDRVRILASSFMGSGKCTSSSWSERGKSMHIVVLKNTARTSRLSRTHWNRSPYNQLFRRVSGWWCDFLVHCVHYFLRPYEKVICVRAAHAAASLWSMWYVID